MVFKATPGVLLWLATALQTHEGTGGIGAAPAPGSALRLSLRGGNLEEPDCIRLSGSAALGREWRRAQASPTGDQVHEVATRMLPDDLAYLLGPQNMSMSGHESSLRRVNATLDYLEMERQGVGKFEEQLMRLHSRCHYSIERSGGSCCMHVHRREVHALQDAFSLYFMHFLLLLEPPPPCSLCPRAPGARSGRAMP